MPRTVEEVVDMLHHRYENRLHKAPLITIRWDEFYDEICQNERFAGTRLDDITERACEKHRLLISYGDRVVLVARDRFYRPSRSRH